MPNVTFSSYMLKKDVTVYAIAGDTSTILAVADANTVKVAPAEEPHPSKVQGQQG